MPVQPDAPNLFHPIHEDDTIAHTARLLEVASVPATVVNWGGSETVSVEEWCACMAALTGLEAKFVTTEQTVPSLPVDVTRMHEIVGPTRVAWRDGMRRTIEARHGRGGQSPSRLTAAGARRDSWRAEAIAPGG